LKAKSLIYGIVYCLLSAAIGLVVFGVGGAIVGGKLIQEEARGPVNGFLIGGTLGFLAGICFGILAVSRRK